MAVTPIICRPDCLDNACIPCLEAISPSIQNTPSNSSENYLVSTNTREFSNTQYIHWGERRLKHIDPIRECNDNIKISNVWFIMQSQPILLKLRVTLPRGVLVLKRYVYVTTKCWYTISKSSPSRCNALKWERWIFLNFQSLIKSINRSYMC